MEGPRGLRKEELESLGELTGGVFRPHMLEQFAHLFDGENFENLRVCVDNRRCVSHVGMIQQEASLFGCRIKTCCIGGVSTHPDYRKQGLASACFDDAVAKAYGDSVDVMIVSGDRNLYRMRGCVHVGSDLAYTVEREMLAKCNPNGVSNLSVTKMTNAELPWVQDCYRREPVRFVRSPDLYRLIVSCGWVMNRPSDFLVIREGGDFRGYIILQQPSFQGRARFAEFAGDRKALFHALPTIFHRYGLTSLGFQVMGHDTQLRSLCQQAGWQGTPCTTPGTVKLINFPQLIARIRPLFEERVGRKAAAQLTCLQEEDKYAFTFGNQTWETDRDTTTRLLFGTLEGFPPAIQEVTGALGEVLRTVFPLPTLWYGMNYV